MTRQAEEKETEKKKRKEKQKKGKRIKIFVEILTEIIISKRTFLKSPEEMEAILKMKIARKTKKYKITNLFPEEIASLQQIILSISQRDEKFFTDICHQLRNRFMSLGGFCQQVSKLSKEITRTLNLFPNLSSKLKKAEISTSIIGKEIKRTEKVLNNKIERKKKAP